MTTIIEQAIFDFNTVLPLRPGGSLFYPIALMRQNQDNRLCTCLISNGSEIALADQRCTAGTPAQAARDEGMELQVIKLPEAKKVFVLLPRRWVVERNFA